MLMVIPPGLALLYRCCFLTLENTLSLVLLLLLWFLLFLTFFLFCIQKSHYVFYFCYSKNVFFNHRIIFFVKNKVLPTYLPCNPLINEITGSTGSELIHV